MRHWIIGCVVRLPTAISYFKVGWGNNIYYHKRRPRISRILRSLFSGSVGRRKGGDCFEGRLIIRGGGFPIHVYRDARQRSRAVQYCTSRYVTFYITVRYVTILRQFCLGEKEGLRVGVLDLYGCSCLTCLLCYNFHRCFSQSCVCGCVERVFVART